MRDEEVYPKRCAPRRRRERWLSPTAPRSGSSANPPPDAGRSAGGDFRLSPPQRVRERRNESKSSLVSLPPSLCGRRALGGGGGGICGGASLLAGDAHRPRPPRYGAGERRKL